MQLGRSTGNPVQEPGSRATEAISIPAAETFVNKTAGFRSIKTRLERGGRIETVTQRRGRQTPIRRAAGNVSSAMGLPAHSGRRIFVYVREFLSKGDSL